MLGWYIMSCFNCGNPVIGGEAPGCLPMSTSASARLSKPSLSPPNKSPCIHYKNHYNRDRLHPG